MTEDVVVAGFVQRRVSSQRILGKSIFWWMDRVGILRASRVGKYLMKTDAFPGKTLELGRLRRRDIRVVGCLTHADGKRVGFAGADSPDATRQPVLRLPMRGGVE